MKFLVRGYAGAGLFSLFGSFEQEFSHRAAGQALHKVVEWAVLESTLTAAVHFAASQVLFDIGRPQKNRLDADLLHQSGLLHL